MELLIIMIIAIWLVCLFMTLAKFDEMAWTPASVYECNNVNWFGAILLWLFFVAINPLGCIVRFLWFIFHVGRK